MTHSDTITDLLTALCAARLEFPTITRNREGFSKRTGQKYQYADLNAIIDATEPILGQHGLLMVQSLDDGDGGTLRIISTLFHAASGQWVSSEVSVEKPGDMQSFGMAATYIKRYAQQALLNVSTEDDDDAASLNDSHKADKSAATANGRGSEPVNGNGHTPPPELYASLEHPTESHLAALKNLALTECREELEVYEDRLRRTMGVPKHASVSPRWYVNLEKQLAKSKGQEVTRADHTSEASVSQPEPAAPAEVPAAVPPPASAAESTSAASDPSDAVERDRQRLRAEVASWNLRISDKEREHVIVHNSYSRARQLLWQTRVDAPTATPIESAAD
jgi:hypothetical protein